MCGLRKGIQPLLDGTDHDRTQSPMVVLGLFPSRQQTGGLRYTQTGTAGDKGERKQMTIGEKNKDDP